MPAAFRQNHSWVFLKLYLLHKTPKTLSTTLDIRSSSRLICEMLALAKWSAPGWSSVIVKPGWEKLPFRISKMAVRFANAIWYSWLNSSWVMVQLKICDYNPNALVLCNNTCWEEYLKGKLGPPNFWNTIRERKKFASCHEAFSLAKLITQSAKNTLKVVESCSGFLKSSKVWLHYWRHEIFNCSAMQHLLYFYEVFAIT